MDEHGRAASRHPEHDRLHEEVSSWYQTSVPGLGYHAEPRRFGVYRRHAEQPDSGLIIVKSVAPDEVPEFLADARSYFETGRWRFGSTTKTSTPCSDQCWLRQDVRLRKRIRTSLT